MRRCDPQALWVLDYLFRDSPWRNALAFKGGTSLSKAFAAIERFSEDIDLILDWRSLGYVGDEPWADRSPTQQDAFGKTANKRTAEFLARQFVPVIEANGVTPTFLGTDACFGGLVRCS